MSIFFYFSSTKMIRASNHLTLLYCLVDHAQLILMPYLFTILLMILIRPQVLMICTTEQVRL